MDWSDRVVYLTGASSGIGRVLAEQLGEKGASITLVARSEDKLRRVAETVENNGGASLVQPLDVRDESAVEDSITETVDRFGGLDCAIANAGVSWKTEAHDLTLESVRETFNINVFGLVNTMKLALDEMLDSDGGQLVAVSSMASFRGLPGKAAYCASKAAVARFAESFRLDLKDEPVDVTTIYPGYVKTPMTEHYPQDDLMFLVPVDDACRKIIDAIENRRRQCMFPWQMKLMANFMSLLPDGLADWFVSRSAAPMTDEAPEGP